MRGAYHFFRLAASLLLLAVATDAAAQRLPVKAYTIESGLAHNRVKRIVQDSRGFLWFCTAAGLSRFDGYQFTNYGIDQGLTALSLNDFLETADGVYWIATNSDGIVRFDLRSGAAGPANSIESRLTVYSVSGEPVTNRVNVLYQDRSGMLWAGTDGGLFSLNERAGEKRLQPVTLGIPSHPDIQVQVWAIADDGAGNLWIATTFGLIRRLRNGEMIRYAVQPSVDDDQVAAVVIDGDGSVWVGHRAGLFHFNPGSESVKSTPDRSRSLPRDTRHYTTADGLDNNTVLAVRRSHDGHIWIRTFGSALAEFDGHTFRTYAVGERLGDTIGSLAEDREGNLWLGTTAIGALKVMRNGWTIYSDADGLGESVASIVENRTGELYVNSSGWHLSRFDGARFSTVRLRLPKTVSDASWRDVNGILQDHVGEWWVAARQGLFRFPKVDRFEDLARVPPVAVYTTSEGLATSDVTRLFEDSRGDIWISSWVQAPEPLVRWERTTGRFHRYSQRDGLRPFVSALVFQEDKAGNIWVGFREQGVVRYRDGHFTTIGPDKGLPTGSVNSMYFDPAGRLWLTVGQKGLCRIDRPEADDPRVVTYSTTDGLASNFVVHVTGDGTGRIYVTHMRGIDRLDPATSAIKHYSTADGLPGSEYKMAFRDRGGALWFCTTTGVARFLPAANERTSLSPILIGGLRISGIPHPVSMLGERAVSGLRLQPDHNNIQVDFFSLGFRAGETVRYQYKLEGAAGDWSAPATRRSVDFANLAPGVYRFLARTVSAEGVPGTSAASVAFEILPPVWRRSWFLALVASIVGSLTIAFARYRHERLKALRESENRFRTLAETASDAIITINEESRIVFVNHAAETVFGYTREEMLGATLTMLMPAHMRDRHVSGFSRYRQTGERHISWDAAAVPGLRKDGQEIPLEISFAEFTRNNQRFFTGIARDVTERKRAEEALRRSREERLAELERVRKRIATDLHDDVGSTLTRISLLSEVVRRQVDRSDPSLDGPLSGIASLSRELVSSMSDIVWAINPTKDHLSDLSRRMRQFVSDVCTARQIAFRFNTPSSEHDLTVGANLRREVFLLFKEAVNNMVRHSECTEADLDFRAGERALMLRVTDNGCGFDPSSIPAGHGLRSMRERTEALGGHLDVRSRPGTGTTLSFAIPFIDHPHSTVAESAPTVPPHEYVGTAPRRQT
jgi:PAS domain S-box-containing protein